MLCLFEGGLGRLHKGLCSNYLNDLTVGAQVYCYVRRFAMNSLLNVGVVMILKWRLHRQNYVTLVHEYDWLIVCIVHSISTYQRTHHCPSFLWDQEQVLLHFAHSGSRGRQTRRILYVSTPFHPRDPFHPIACFLKLVTRFIRPIICYHDVYK